MLLNLHIRNFAIVPALEQEFEPGFTAISGETGAGKSILVDALGLLVGDRSDSSWVQAGADRAELTAEFTAEGNEAARNWLREHELGADEVTIVRRTIQSSGRSRAWINGTPVTVSQLAELGQLLVEIHGQNEHLRLIGQKRQRELLDSTGDYAQLLTSQREAFEHWHACASALSELQQSVAASPGELELMRYQLDELRNWVLDGTALSELELEQRRLSHSEDLLQALQGGLERLDDDDGGVVRRLSSVLDELRKFQELDPEIAESVRMIEESVINCQEAVNSLQAAGDRVELNPERLAAVNEQLSHLADLSRKHAVPMEDLQDVARSLEQRLQASEGYESRQKDLQADVDSALEDYRKQARKLSQARNQHAKALSGQVVELMNALGMEGGRFEIVVTPDHEAEPARTGDDRIEIQVSANPGMPMGSLAKVASGGELSRLSLAIKVACSAAGQGRTQIFDEVDAGVGGDTANAVGELLKQASLDGQALCVTHLAQVAVRADHQLKVLKQRESDHTALSTQLLESTDRVEEIARMLGGKISEQSRAHAQEMLEGARHTLQ